MQISLRDFAKSHSWRLTLLAALYAGALTWVLDATPLAPVLLILWLPVFLIGVGPILASTELVCFVLGPGEAMSRAHLAVRRVVAAVSAVTVATYLIGNEPWTYLQSTPFY
ncbi:hypothetical protein [Shimia ponticola]|uniref:hypothetical protein n=1 Tax=Shimia ponticola TaxID=2582893 RepID=UPI0011BE9943|nr:hypothetical protein [Shimia ponticola]